MKSHRLIVDLQFDSKETAILFAQVLAKTMGLIAEKTIELAPQESAHVRLGKTTLESCDEFRPNKD